MRVNRFQEIAPRTRPYARIPLMNLDDAVLMKGLFDLKNGGPEDRFGSIIFYHPEGSVWEVLGFQDGCKVRIFFSGNILGCMENKASVHNVKVSNAGSPLSFDWQMSSQERKWIGEVGLSS